MKRGNSLLTWLRKMAALGLLGSVLLVCVANLASDAKAQTPNIGPGNVIVQTAMGGFVLGYDIDQTGTEGLLAESLTLPNFLNNVAIETFDQKTGKILKIVEQQLNTKSDFVALGIFGHSTGLIEYEHVTNLFVDKRLYGLMNPLKSNLLTGKWTPGLMTDQIIMGTGVSQGSANTPFLVVNNTPSGGTFVFGSNVAANTFGPQITLTDPNFVLSVPPVIAYDSKTNQAVLSQSDGGILSTPDVGTVDLTTGAQTSFKGLGFGFVNGIAVDSEAGMAFTTTEVDFGVEFYDLATQTGFEVPMPGATSQAQRGEDVEFDPIHKLVLVGQPISSTGPGSSIQVFNEQGNLVESINGLSLPASAAYIALHPSVRAGYVIVTPALTTLQSFTY